MAGRADWVPLSATWSAGISWWPAVSHAFKVSVVAVGGPQPVTLHALCHALASHCLHIGGDIRTVPDLRGPAVVARTLTHRYDLSVGASAPRQASAEGLAVGARLDPHQSGLSLRSGGFGTGVHPGLSLMSSGSLPTLALTPHLVSIADRCSAVTSLPQGASAIRRGPGSGKSHA